MSNIVLQPNASGTGNITIATPNTNTDRTLNIPDVAGDIVTTGDTGTVSPTMLAGGHGGFKSMQVFTSTGANTWTKPAGINTIKVYVTGGGGGGYSGSSNYNGGSGGGAGATAIKVIDVSAVSTVSVTVGVGGTGGTGDTYNNTSGSSSSFGSYCTAGGGERGFREYQKTGTLAEGGAATGGDINIAGGDGGSGGGGVGADEPPSSGQGGVSYWGGSGTNGANATSPVDSRAYGAGGSGGDHTGSVSIDASDGAGGVVVVEEYS